MTFVLLFSGPSFASRINVDFFKNYYVSERGFQLKTQNTNWLKSSSSAKDVEILFQLKPELKNKSATLSVRIDDETKASTLEDYVKTWVPKFPQFGLDVLNYQYYKMTPQVQAFVVDLTNTTSGKYVRQVFFHKNKRAIIFTCMDDQKNYKSTVSNCNELIKTFTWVQETTNSKPVLN